MMLFERHAATAAQSSMCSAHTGEQGLGAARSGRAFGGKSRLVDAQHNATPFCISTNKIKVYAGLHQHQLLIHTVDSVFGFVMNLIQK